MGANFKPYSPQVDSGVPWLGKVPKNWRVTKLRHVLRRRTERNRPDLPLLSVVREKGVIRRDATSLEENHNYIPDDLSNYKVVRAGQFAMNKMKAWQGSYGVSGHDGIVSPAYYVFDVSRVDASFFHVSIRSLAYVPAFTRASDGVRIGQWDLAEERMRGILFLVPPSVEQGAIVRFLDHVDRLIRRYIRTKQKLIALLEEQKQAIIHQAVTGQIDVRTGQPYSSYKPSGVEWLGRVPAHWNVRRVKQVSHVQGGFAFPSSSFGDEGIPVVRMSDIERGVLCLDSAVRIPEHGCKDDYALKEGDILYGLSGSIGATGSLGNYAIVKRDSVPAQMNQRVARFRPRTVQLSDTFLVYVLQTKSFYTQVLSYTSGTDQFNVSTGDIGNIFIALPPVDEQQPIVRRLRATAARIDADIRRARREIDLLREYRTRLVADVVTGKVDVRESATSLPAADSSGPDDDLDGALDTAADKDIHELDHNR